MNELVRETNLDAKLLLELLQNNSTEGERQRAAEALYKTRRQAFRRLGEELATFMLKATRDASLRWDAALNDADAGPGVPAQAVREFLDQTSEDFESYDVVAFPMLYGTGLGEADEVEVLRISPEDAPRPSRGAKVTGSRHWHFGAFLDRRWRENDILWGRLDAAEILITMAVPNDHDHRASLIKEFRDSAHRQIIRDYLGRTGRDSVIQTLTQVLLESYSGRTNELALRDLLRGSDGSEGDRVLKVLQVAAEDDPRLLRFYRETYEAPNELPPRAALGTIGRGAHIMGQVVAGVSEQRRVSGLSKAFTWASRLGRLLFGMVEASVPGTWHHLVVRHWLVLLYIFELLALAGGLLLGAPSVQRFGVLALVITLFFHLGVGLIGDRLRGGRLLVRIVGVLILLIVGATVALAIFQLLHLGREYPWIPFFGRESPAPSPSPP